jgi:hypothetical protein
VLQFSFWLAILTFIGFAFLWAKLPKGLRRFLRKRSLLFDLIISIGVYIFLGATLTALLSAALFGIMVSIYLWIANRSGTTEQSNK